MRRNGMPMAMWAVFAKSFEKQLTEVFGYDAKTAKAIRKTAKLRYKEIIAKLPEFEKGDRFQLNIIGCAMLGAFVLSMPRRPDVESLTDYYEKAQMTPLMKWFCRQSGKSKFTPKDIAAMKATAARRAADRNPYSWNMGFYEYPDGSDFTGDPTETAIALRAAREGFAKTRLDQDFPRRGEAPFDAVRKRMATCHTCPGGGVLIAVKGAPEAVLAQCTHLLGPGGRKPLDAGSRGLILSENRILAGQALRVLAVAQREETAAPKQFDAQTLEHDLTFVGLIGMMDPPRPEARTAVDRCAAAGIRPIMITGDHKETAVAIARQLNIFRPGDKAIDGLGLDFLPQEALEEEIERVSVYARVTPEHKLRIVQAWQKKGRVVAMTGDGVNDAPALRAADIGCAMGKTGTDVAKGAADMILTDDNFATVVAAVEQGRGIYANIRKAIHYLLSCNIGEILTIFLATVLPFSHAPLTPVQLLWLNLVTDSLPALALGMEPVERRVMDQPPRDPHEPLFSRAFSRRLAWQGILVGGITLLAYGLGLHLSNDYAVANTMAFATLTLSQLFHAFDVRSERTSLFRLGIFSNPAMNKAFLVGLLLQAAVLLAPPLQAAFSVVSLTLSLWGVTLGLAVTPLIVCEIVKGVHRAAHPKTVQETAAAPH